MRVLWIGFISVLFVFVELLVFSAKASAAPVCGGTITCHQILTQCTNSCDNNTCLPTDVLAPGCSCNCTTYCAGTPLKTDSCSTFSQSLCTDSQWWITYCDTGCLQSGALFSATCNWQVDACTGGGQCASGFCCGGTPNYCSSVGFDCAGNPTAPTATPVPPTPASVGCPAVQNGFPNQCRDACLSGSTQVNEIPNTACQGTYGATINACCNVTGACPAAPAGGTNTCRAGSTCSAGESVYSAGSGNAVCANSLGLQTGNAVCCFLPSGGATPIPSTPPGAPTATPTSAVPPTPTPTFTPGCIPPGSGGCTNFMDCCGGASGTATCVSNTCFSIPTPTPTTPVPTPTPTSTPAPGACQVTTSPPVLNLSLPGSGTVTANVTSGLGNASISQMNFGSYNTSIATVNPALVVVPTPVPAMNVSIMDDFFSPDRITINAGDTILWTVTGTNPHTVTLFGDFDSGVLFHGQTYRHTFNEPAGSYAIVDQIHPGVMITVTIVGTAPTPTPISTTVSSVAAGNTAVWATATLSDGRTCQSTSTTDTDVPVAGPTPTPTPTTGPGTPTPTPGPATYTISGTVYVDTNGNGVQDIGESGYSGAGITATGKPPVTSGPTGDYSFSGFNAGTYTVALTVPLGYTATTTNPVSEILGPSTTVNFGIRSVPPPVCNPASLSANPTTVNPGGTSALSVSGCTGVKPTPTIAPPPPFVWNPDPTGNCPGASITNTFSPDGTQASSTWNAPTCPASSLTCSPSVGVTGPGGTTTYSANIAVNSAYSVTANVQEDLSNNGCTAGSSAYSGSVTLSLTNTGTGATLNQNTITGSTTFTCQNAGSYNLSMGVPTGYRITNRTVSPGGFGLVLNNGVSFALGPSQTATFCISKLNPWYQTTTGDVRKVSITNKVPAGAYASSDPLSPSLFLSSNWNSDFGSGQASALGWKVDSEYDYNKNSLNRNGTANYSYYMFRINQTGVTATALANCNATSCALTNLATGVYTATGPITITQYSQAAGAHVVLLVNGDATIKSSIKVPAGAHNLFVLAAKGNVTIDRSVGEALFSSSVTDVEGVITAEGSVTADGTQCNGGTPDLRLNIGGTVVANALKPFATAGTGVFTNNRSLCANDLTTPSVTFSPRFDFITELTDFYRTISSRWKEVQP